MAVKRKREKVILKRKMDHMATKILCKYCDLRDTCKFKGRKEQLEGEGTITRCTITPNKKGKSKKAEQVNHNGIPINANY